MTFADRVKDRKQNLADSQSRLVTETDVLVSDLELRNDELESDLANAIEDKDKFMGLVEELVAYAALRCRADCYGYESTRCYAVEPCTNRNLITKAKEALP